MTLAILRPLTLIIEGGFNFKYHTVRILYSGMEENDHKKPVDYIQKEQQSIEWTVVQSRQHSVLKTTVCSK